MTAPVRAPAPAERRTIPFDYAFRFDLLGEPERTYMKTVRVSVEANFVAVAIGYGLIPRRDPIRFGPARVEDIDLDPAVLARLAVPAGAPAGAAPLSRSQVLALPADRIPRGVQALRPAMLAIAAGAIPGGAVALAAAGPGPGAAWPPTLADFRMSWITNSLRRVIREEGAASLSQPRPQRQRAADLFEVLTRGIRFNRAALETLLARGEDAELRLQDLETLFEEIPPDDAPIRFLYRLLDEGTGREFQSDPILNTAGLGIANGDRPFRQFAVPIVFEPLTTIRMDVTEKTAVPAELHVALHGYRTLGGAGTPTDGRRPR
jgi:hypothetical protein